MANFELLNDVVETIPILVDDAGGNPVPAPAGDVFTATTDTPSLNAVIGVTPTGAPAVSINATVQVSPGRSLTVSDSAGLSVFTLLVDIVADATPKSITLDLANATSAPQAVPTNPGP